MPLSIPEVLGFLPKTTALISKAVDTVSQIKALPVKDAKTVGAALGVAPGSVAADILELVDDVIGAAKT
jgi:hypothetical protein